MSYRDKQKQRAYQNNQLKQRRLDWLAKNGPCTQCGSSENLEVDHIDRKQKVDHKVWSWRQERRENELVKCQVLCERCHKIKSAAECPKGAEKTQSKLTEEQVIAIRAEYRPGVRGYGGKSLAKKYNVTHWAIWSIINRINWKHVA